MDKERQISNEQILYYLIQERKGEATQIEYEHRIVDEGNCKDIGLYTYEKDGNKISTELFLITETHNGKVVNLIYDEKGKVIAWKNEEGKMQLEVADDIDIDIDTLNRGLELGEERTNNPEEDPTTNGTAKAGDGRDLGSKEHEEKDIKNMPQNETTKKEPNGQEEELKNLREYDKNLIDGQPLIRLDQIINGYPLWELLGMEEKFKDKLPNGINPKIFRTGFLTIVKAEELEAQDGKKRSQQEVFAVTSFDRSVVIELDEEVLRPVPLDRTIEQQRIEESVIRKEDGEETKKSSVNTEVTRTSLYEIPNVKDRFSSDEGYRLAVDKDRDRMLNNKRQAGGHDQEITFIQYSLDNSYTERERGEKSVEYRLKSIDEPRIKGDPAKDAEMEAELMYRGTDESKRERKEHIDELVDECFKEYKDLGELYNRKDITTMVVKLHNRGNGDEEIKKYIGEMLEEAKDTEHDMPIPGQGKRG